MINAVVEVCIIKIMYYSHIYIYIYIYIFQKNCLFVDVDVIKVK